MSVLLSPEERQTARELWNSLMLASSQARLDAAREALKLAPPPVKREVTAAIVALWSQGLEPERDYTPFD